MRNYISAQERKKIIEEYRRSNLSKTKFCKEHKLALVTFYRWLKKDDLIGEKLNFVSLSVKNSLKENDFIKNQPTEKIVLKPSSSVSIELPNSICVHWLSALLKELTREGI